MKRLICRMLPFVIVFIITACGASQSEQGSERQTEPSSTAKLDEETRSEPEAEKEETQCRKNDNENSGGENGEGENSNKENGDEDNIVSGEPDRDVLRLKLMELYKTWTD